MERQVEGEGQETPIHAQDTSGTLLAELRPTLVLATPVVLAELGWMAMGVVDLVMVGRLGPEAIGAVGIGNILFFCVTVIGIGLLMGLDTFVSQSFGAGRVRECHRWMIQGLYLALIMSPPLVGLALALIPNMGLWGIAPEVSRVAGPYLGVLAWSAPPLFVFFVLRRYLQGMNLVRVVMATLVIANVVNWLGNWILIYGHFGVPALGVRGSALATLLSRTVMAILLAVYAVWHSTRHGTGLLQTSWRPELGRLAKLIGLGLPAAGHFLLEVGVFGGAAVLAGRLGATALAAHEVVLHAASVTFMVPLGISSAGSVRVGQALGRGDRHGAARAGWVALGLGGGFMACAGLTFLFFPRPILGLFTGDNPVIAAALPLLGAAAMFQLFDGLQVVASGALRGAGDTRTPMIASLAAYWVIGLPVGYVLGFPMGRGVLGIWMGLALGLICAGSILLASWARTVARLKDGRIASVVPVADEAACACG
jgi:MATE family multidrug resistance protein